MTLRDSEVGLVVALEVLGGQATTEEIATFAGMNIDYVRNLVARLRSEGIIESVSASVGFGFLGKRRNLAGREMINVLMKPFEEILDGNELAFLKWGQIVFKTPTKADLVRKIEDLKKEQKKECA
jgi:DNA-binding Lrp family transcriptional regulator